VTITTYSDCNLKFDGRDNIMSGEDVSDIWKQMEEYDALMAKQVYLEEGRIVIEVAYKYEIALNRCDNAEKILAWVLQIRRRLGQTLTLLEGSSSLPLRKTG